MAVPVTYETLDEIEQVSIANEKSVQALSLLVADLRTCEAILAIFGPRRSNSDRGGYRTRCSPDCLRKCEYGIRINSVQHMIERIVLSHIALLFLCIESSLFKMCQH